MMYWFGLTKQCPVEVVALAGQNIPKRSGSPEKDGACQPTAFGRVVDLTTKQAEAIMGAAFKNGIRQHGSAAPFRVSKLIPGVGEEALAFLARGDYFGEMALIDRLPRSAEAKAHSEGALVLSIPRDVLEGILNIQKVSSVRLLRLLSSLVAHRLREGDDRLVGWHVLAAGQSGG